MELKELIELVKGILINDYKDVNITGFSTDTRTINNEVYIALKGKNLDGHRFITNDLKASVVISEEEIYLDDIPVIKVSNTYDSLYYIGRYIKDKYNIPVIAITGSNGKTTLKELIYNILSTKYKVLKNKENYNNIIGIFNTIKKLNNTYDLCILEMGMNHKGEISTLSKMVQPTTGIITNVGSAHIGYLKNKKQIYKAKMEILDGLNGDLIVNGDDKYLKKSNSFKCGSKLSNDLIAYKINIYSDYMCFDIYVDQEYQVIFNIPSKYYISTILEAIKVGLEYNIDIKTILKVIKEFKSVDKRLKYIKINNYTIVDDTYNASYESVRCGLNTINQTKNRKIIILGDMLELGKFSKKYHKKINGLLKEIDNKEVITVGNYTKYIKSNHFNNNQHLINYLKSIDLKNKYIYLKGSRKMKLDEIVKYLMK